MRIVGGIWRGRPIAAPEGRDTRPTTDRVRESLASMLLAACALDLSGMHVLDAFAGSGAIGLELLSRGASWCTFVDRNRRAQQAVRSNLDALAVPRSSATLQAGEVVALAEAGRLVGAPFDVVVLDPPYAMPADSVEQLVGLLAQTGALWSGALVVYEHASGSSGLANEGLELVRDKTHGATSVTLYRMRDA